MDINIQLQKRALEVVSSDFIRSIKMPLHTKTTPIQCNMLLVSIFNTNEIIIDSDISDNLNNSIVLPIFNAFKITSCTKITLDKN